jgi:hypothetical protein
MPVVDQEKIQLSLLPGRTQELVSVTGITAALVIVELRGGIRLSVPVKANPDHWLVPHIGLNALQALVDYYRGEEIEIDRCVRALAAIKEQAILDESTGGTSNTQLAVKYGYTERGMRKLRRRVEKLRGFPPSPQTDLFK